MNIDIYNTTSKKSSVSSQITSLFFEPLILSLLAVIGLIGTIFMFQQNPNQIPSNAYLVSSVEPRNNEDISPVAAKNDFDKMVKISGKERAGEELEFSLIFDKSQSRYVMEMGDGMRIILTQESFKYTYAEKGTYLLEIKEINLGVINTVASKKVKIK